MSLRPTAEVASTDICRRHGLQKLMALVGVRTTLCLCVYVLAFPQRCFGEEEIPMLRSRPSPMGALLRSTVAPGWGQWYVGSKPKGVLIAAAAAAIVWQGFAAHRDGREKDRQKLTVWGSLLWLYAMTDAYVGAHLSRFEEEMLDAEGFRSPPTEE